jgi:hypothetical protein
MGNSPPALPPENPPLGTKKVLWGAAILALSNIAALLKAIKELIEAIDKVQIIIPDQVPFWAFEGLIGVAVVIGNVFLFRYIFVSLKGRLSTWKRALAASGIAMAIVLIVVVNVHAIVGLRVNPLLTRTRLLTELSGAQQLGQTGGFASYANDLGSPDDAWSTAQAIKAIFSVSGKLEDNERLKSAFRYLKAKRTSTGYWNANPQNGPPFIRTEISCWVALAYLASLRQTGFWSPQESNDVVNETSSVLHNVVAIQNNTGAWAPVIAVDTSFDRTYPTLMAVWALSDAMKTEDLPRDFRESLGGNLERGIFWLIQKYKPGYGWDENPQRHISKKFDGLTFEILLILKSAEDIARHNSFKDMEAYRAIKRDVVNLIPQAFPVQDVFAIPGGDQSVNNQPCWATFAAYPWSLAALSALSKDPDIPSSDRRKLNKIRQQEFEELNDVPSFLANAETWLLAENLLGLNVALRENGTR